MGGVILNKEFECKFENLLKNSHSHWIVFDNEAFIGLISLDLHHNQMEYEVSYQILPDFWGKGLASQCLHFLLEQARNQGLNSVLAETQTQNIRSVKLLEKSGFILIEKLERHKERQSIYRKII